MADVGPATMEVRFYMPVQATLVEGWQDAVWDAALRAAHEQGKLPVGPILISDPVPYTGVPAGLTEGQPMTLHNPLQMPGGVQVVEVVATMMLGADLG